MILIKHILYWNKKKEKAKKGKKITVLLHTFLHRELCIFTLKQNGLSTTAWKLLGLVEAFPTITVTLSVNGSKEQRFLLPSLSASQKTASPAPLHFNPSSYQVSDEEEGPLGSERQTLPRPQGNLSFAWSYNYVITAAKDNQTCSPRPGAAASAAAHPCHHGSTASRAAGSDLAVWITDSLAPKGCESTQIYCWARSLHTRTPAGTRAVERSSEYPGRDHRRRCKAAYFSHRICSCSTLQEISRMSGPPHSVWNPTYTWSKPCHRGKLFPAIHFGLDNVNASGCPHSHSRTC